MTEIGCLSLILSIACLVSIAYHKKRIRELTIGLGQLLDEVDRLKEKATEYDAGDENINDKKAEVIADLFFAYMGKDEDFPHQFEIKALEESLYYLQEHYKGNRYNLKMFEEYIKGLHDLLGY